MQEDRLLPKLNCDFIRLLEQKGMQVANYRPPGAPPLAFDEEFGGKIPRVMVDSVEPFPADIPQTVPLNRIVETIVSRNQTNRVLLREWLE